MSDEFVCLANDASILRLMCNAASSLQMELLDGTLDL
jgi:hypothetical protein